MNNLELAGQEVDFGKRTAIKENLTLLELIDKVLQDENAPESQKVYLGEAKKQVEHNLQMLRVGDTFPAEADEQDAKLEKAEPRTLGYEGFPASSRIIEVDGNIDYDEENAFPFQRKRNNLKKCQGGG